MQSNLSAQTGRQLRHPRACGCCPSPASTRGRERFWYHRRVCPFAAVGHCLSGARLIGGRGRGRGGDRLERGAAHERLQQGADGTLTAQAVQQPMRQAHGSSRPCSSASCRMYLRQPAREGIT